MLTDAHKQLLAGVLAVASHMRCGWLVGSGVLPYPEQGRLLGRQHRSCCPLEYVGAKTVSFDNSCVCSALLIVGATTCCAVAAGDLQCWSGCVAGA